MEVAGFKGENEEGWNDRIEESVGEDVIVFSDTDIRRGKRQKSVKRSPGRRKDSVMIVQSRAKTTVGLNH